MNISKPKIDKEKEGGWWTTGKDDMMETNTGETLMTDSNGNGKMDALVESVSRFTGGFTYSNERFDRIDRSIERQERNIDRLATLFEQQSQQELEALERLERIVENLLER
ncbi:MAG: hypothetical protein HC852_11940 [Acaryochloridaceae cyanobacterium RU_4_10]|nr:hypothetical protein [Acaryochloridaceae cyanobacterium RU_4_10]